MFLPPNTLVVAGPVIIENNRVLLDREQRDVGPDFFTFPGGTVTNFAESFEDTCRREAQEELGIELDILRPLATLLIRRPEAKDSFVLLIHFLAKRIGDIKPGPKTLEWGWYDINNLPANCAPNIKMVLEKLSQEKL